MAGYPNLNRALDERMQGVLEWKKSCIERAGLAWFIPSAEAEGDFDNPLNLQLLLDVGVVL